MKPLSKDVLVVDDDEGIRNLVAVALSRAGLTLDTAADGVHAVEHLTERTYTVLLIDQNMPRLDGAGVLKTMRAFYGDDSERPIVLVMTAASDPEPLQAVADMVHAVISKPFDLYRLRELVQDCLVARQGFAQHALRPAVGA